MALVARDMDAIAPEIVPDTRSGLRLLQARHPLLMTAVVERVGIARRSTREPVPVTIEIKAGASILVIEPIARRVNLWWNSWRDAMLDAGGRGDDWRFRDLLPPRQRTLAKGAGLDVQEMTARSLYLPGRRPA
jgi:hypothetical protein